MEIGADVLPSRDCGYRLAADGVVLDRDAWLKRLLGWGADQLKVGSFTSSERMAKWNQCLRIDDTLGGCLPLRKLARWG